jgi:hypothetical protein
MDKLLIQMSLLGEVRLIPARISKYITETGRHSVRNPNFYAIKQV